MTPSFPIKTLQAGNTLFHYQDEGTGTPLVLIHGSLCDLRYWRWQTAELAQHCRIIVPSLPHYWPQTGNNHSEFSIYQHARDIHTLLDALEIDSAHILGHSRGGSVAIELAMEHAHKVSSLILADPGIRTRQQTSQANFKHEALLAIQEGEIDKGVALFIDAVSGEGTWKRMVRWFKEMVRNNAQTLLLQTDEPAFYFDTSRFASLNLPVCLLGGSDSPDPFPDIMSRLEYTLPQVYRHTLTPASHGMNLSLPHEFNRIVLEHIRHTAA
ncbi:MAG: alpha/beta hydrolase [Alcaligenaceae bacterium]|nr:alpha/beta hydrolase [Alcaligenaceae bacterium]